MIDQFTGDFFQWLRGFYHVARSGSIAHGAKRMFRSQSSVSYHIQCLERELGVPLFKRVNNRLLITPEGSQLLEWTIATFEQVNDLRSSLCSDPQSLSGKVGISGSMPIVGQSEMVALLSKFMQEHPRVQVQLRACRPREAMVDLDEGVSDIAIIAVIKPPERYLLAPLCMSPFVLVTPKNASFELDPVPTREQLQKLPFITYMGNDRSEMYSPWLGKEQLEGLAGPTVMTVNQYQLILQYIVSGVGCAVMDVLSLRLFEEDVSKTCQYPLDQYLDDLQYSMVTRRHRNLNSAAIALRQKIMGMFSV